MKREDKSAGERCREDIADKMGEVYPKRVTRAALTTCDWGWSGAQIDNGLHKLKKDGVITKDDDDGYQLRTAPDSYNARMIAERNGMVPQYPPAAAPLCGVDDCYNVVATLGMLCVKHGPTKPIGPFDEEEQPSFAELMGAIDPVAVRNALAGLNAKLVSSVDNKDLKLEVLDYLGRILDDSIEAVLKSIAEDYRK